MPRDAGDWVRRGIAATAGVLVVLGIGWLGYRGAGVLVLVFVAILLADGLQPIVGSMRARLPMGLGACILLVYGTFLAALILLGVLVVPTAVGELDRFTSALPALLERARAWAGALQPDVLASAATAVVDAALGRSPLRHHPGRTRWPPSASPSARLSPRSHYAHPRLLLADRARATAALRPRLHGPRATGRDPGAWDDVEARLGLWVRGQLILMGSMAIATGAVYSVLGLPSALLLGLIAGIAEAIPMVGPILGAIPAVMVAATVGPEMVAAVAIAYVVIQFVEGNILVPIVMRNTIRMSSFLVIVSLLAGAAIAGMIGAFLAVPVVAAAEAILERLQARDVPVAQVPGGAESDAVDKTPPPGQPVRDGGGLSPTGS